MATITQADKDGIALARAFIDGFERLAYAPNGERFPDLADPSALALATSVITAIQPMVPVVMGALHSLYEQTQGTPPPSWARFLHFVRRLGLTDEQWGALESDPAFCGKCGKPFTLDSNGGILRKACACGGWRIGVE